MEDIVEKTIHYLVAQGHSVKEIELVTTWMKTTCVACKYGKECMERGYIATPYHPKCDRHEFVEEFKK